MRKCDKCNDIKNIEDFFPSHIKRPLHYRTICKKCLRFERKKEAYEAEGICYIATNPAWPEWCKIGITLREDVKIRLRAYQVSTPFRDFKIFSYKKFDNVNEAVKKIYLKLEKELKIEKNGEWFKINPKDAVDVLFNL